jgi:hypothetical protein
VRRLAALAFCLLCAGCDPGAEVVQGFHGYTWGTQVSGIPELAGSERADLGGGLVIHTAPVTVLGREALAGFYFHPRTGRLIEGVYVMPITLEECEREWRRFEQDLRASFPGMEEERHVPERSAADSARYVSDCEYYLYNPQKGEWAITLVNPGRPHDRAGVRVEVEGRSLRLHVFYRGREGQEWAEDPEPAPPRGRPEPPLPPSTPRDSAFGRA